jgi:molecular chaperone GrpE
MSDLNPNETITAEPPVEAAESQSAGPATNGQPAPDQAATAADAGEPPAPTAEETIAQLQEELARAQAKADEYLDRLQRTAAEFQNSRRRQEKQVAEQIERASLHVIQRLIPVLDDLDRAFQNVPPELTAAAGAGPDAQGQVAWVDGFRQIQKKLHALVEDQGVAAIPLVGPFDPTRHEAISSEPHAEVASGHIIETLRIGYEQRGHVIRPALVRIAQ